MTLDDLKVHLLFYLKFVSSKCWHSWNFKKDWTLNKKYIVEKDDFEILRWPIVTSNDLWGHTSFYKKFASL